MKLLKILTLFLASLIGLSVNAAGNNNLVLNDSLSVSLITCFPGPQIYELYGHSAIRIKGQHTPDIVFNYGIFDFAEPNFTYRFVKGEASYILACYDFKYFLEEYRNRKSKVVEQVLNLSQEQCYEMFRLLCENVKPENRAYKYNYIYDNCSTRPRDMIEKVFGKSLQYGECPDSTLTFRQIMHAYNSNYAWQSFGIDIALGYKLDHPISQREQFFAPIYLQQAIERATFTDTTGIKVPAISATNILVEGDDAGNILPATPWIVSPITFALILMLISLIITCCDIKNRKLNRVYDTIIYTLGGIAGILVFFLIFISDHAATSPNLVGLWLNPFYFIPAILLWIKSSWRFLYLYQFINFALLLILTVGGWCLPQYWHPAFYPLILAILIRQFNFILFVRRYA